MSSPNPEDDKNKNKTSTKPDSATVKEDDKKQFPTTIPRTSKCNPQFR